MANFGAHDREIIDKKVTGPPKTCGLVANEYLNRICRTPRVRTSSGRQELIWSASKNPPRVGRSSLSATTMEGAEEKEQAEDPKAKRRARRMTMTTTM